MRTFSCVQVTIRAPSFGERRKDYLRDIAVATNAQLISKDLGLPLEDATPAHVGNAQGVVVRKDRTSILTMPQYQEQIQERYGMLRFKNLVFCLALWFLLLSCVKAWREIEKSVLFCFLVRISELRSFKQNRRRQHQNLIKKKLENALLHFREALQELWCGILRFTLKAGH